MHPTRWPITYGRYDLAGRNYCGVVPVSSFLAALFTFLISPPGAEGCGSCPRTAVAVNLAVEGEG